MSAAATSGATGTGAGAAAAAAAAAGAGAIPALTTTATAAPPGNVVPPISISLPGAAPTPFKPIAWSTFHSYAWRMMFAEGTDVFLPAKLGHNVCPKCKDLFFLRDGCNFRLETAKRCVRDATPLPTPAEGQSAAAISPEQQTLLDQALLDLNAAEVAMKGVQILLEAHRNDDTVQRRTIAKIMRWGVTLAEAAKKSRRWTDPPNQPNSVDGILVVHADGETSRQLPKTALTTGAETMTGFRWGIILFWGPGFTQFRHPCTPHPAPCPLHRTPQPYTP
jgi:hypothetical protein